MTSILNIHSRNSFGKYLGFPIFNKAPINGDFQFIFDSMNTKLVDWKINFLNVTGRTTLARVSLNNIPNHIIQYITLPNMILRKIDRIHRNFIWGTTEVKKKMHLLSWKVVTRPKELGGLGIQRAPDKNKALHAALA